MRFLMACMQFPTAPGHSYMTTELAAALVAAGHQVDVVLLDWYAEPGGPTGFWTTADGTRIVRCTPRLIGGLPGPARAASKFLLSGRHVAREAGRHLDLSHYDTLIAWMPAIAFAPLLARTRHIRHRLLFIWDFFPDHHREIGRIPGGLPFRLARAWEQSLLARFTAILCTLPGNAAYLRRAYHVRPDQRVLVTPIWSDTAALSPVDRASVRSVHALPPDRPIAVFGGQLVEGRGFEQMLGAADAALATGSPLSFLFVGDGRLAPMLRARAGTQGNILYRPAMPRLDYLTLLGACDVGMVATVPGVTSFSIPTKTIDYLRARLPVIAAVEHGSDFVAILERYAIGRAVPFGAAEAFARAAAELAADPAVHDGAARCLDEIFDVRHAVAAIMDAVRA